MDYVIDADFDNACKKVDEFTRMRSPSSKVNLLSQQTNISDFIMKLSPLPKRSFWEWTNRKLNKTALQTKRTIIKESLVWFPDDEDSDSLHDIKKNLASLRSDVRANDDYLKDIYKYNWDKLYPTHAYYKKYISPRLSPRPAPLDTTV